MSERLDNSHLAPMPVATPSEPSRPAVSLQDRVRSLRLPDQRSRAASWMPWLPWVLCLLLAGASAYLGYHTYVTATAGEPDKTPAPRPAATESPPAADKPAGKVALVAGGYIIPVQRVQVSPKVGGEVIKLFIEEGQYVKKGDVLAELDDTKYALEFRRLDHLAKQAKAELDKLETGNRPEERAQAAAALYEAQHFVEQLRDEYNRLVRSRGAASAEDQYRIQSRLQQAEYKVEQLKQAKQLMDEGWRKEDIEKARQAYEHAKAQRDSAKQDLDWTKVVAPISGTILVKRAEVGNTVRPEAFSNGLSASLCDMADLTKLEVDVDVSERDRSLIFEGQVCEVRTEAPSDTVYRGELSRIMPEANRSKASFSVRVRISVPPGDKHLRPEMRARVNFLAGEKPSPK